MSFRMEIQKDFPERCDACNEIVPDRPMLVIRSHCRETGRVQTWIHLDEFEKKFAKLKKQFEEASSARHVQR